MTLSRTHIAGAVLAATLLAGASQPVAAQQRLTGLRTAVVGPVFDSWTFGDGLYQPLVSGSDSVLVESASQWSIPMVVVFPINSRFTLDVSAAYASGTVSLASNDPNLDIDEYQVSGFSDTKIRLTGKLRGDNLLFTLGFNAPTGVTKLDDEELSALRVIASPGLGFAIPTLGTGSAATAGVVFAREISNWAWALGASYEMRGEYSPISVAAGLPTLDFNPSDAIHLSLGSDGLVGQHQMTFGASVDLFTEDKLNSDAPGSPPAAPPTQLGPIYTLEWQLRLATQRFRELSVYAMDRYRTKYKQGDVTVDESSGNYLDAGVRSVLPVGSRMGILANLSLRHQTGLKSDNSLSTAAVATGGLTLGLSRDLGSGYMLQPFVRGQMGKIETGDRSESVTGFGAGVTVSRQF
jgi:hypothetical protein